MRRSIAVSGAALLAAPLFCGNTVAFDDYLDPPIDCRSCESWNEPQAPYRIIGNTYYVALMRTNEKEPKQKAWADSIKVLFPNAGDRGSHVNISGMALAANAPHRDIAVRLMAFLASDGAQKLYAETNHEYPVTTGIAVSEMVASFGQLNADPLPLSEIARNRRIASELVDRVGYNDGPSS